ALDAIGQSAGDGASGRHWLALRRRGGRGADAYARRSVAHVDGILASAAGRVAAMRGVRRAPGRGGPGRPMVQRRQTRRTRMTATATPVPAGAAAVGNGAVLQATGLVRRFGALLATDHVSLALAP